MKGFQAHEESLRHMGEMPRTKRVFMTINGPPFDGTFNAAVKIFSDETL
jgi:hypothetical protein